MIGAIKNGFSEVFDPRSGAEDHSKVVTVAAVPSGFLPHLTDQAGRNIDTELRRKLAPCLFPSYMFLGSTTDRTSAFVTFTVQLSAMRSLAEQL
jgi:hypothetical protein